MDTNSFSAILKVGETVAVEFKHGRNGIEQDTYKTICAFLNRFGGDLFLGIRNNGDVLGIPENAADDLVRQFIKVISNPVLFSPTIYLVPEIITYEGKTVMHIHVPPGSEVHRYQGVAYDRVDDADLPITDKGRLTAMYVRKQNMFTEKQVFKYVTLDDLRLDLLPRVRQLALMHNDGRRPWEHLSDMELLQSAGLYGVDWSTGERGVNLAGIMLLGKDHMIADVCPTYMTDAILRKVSRDRYDDRLIVQTNLIESFDLLMDFAVKNLPDKFYLEDAARLNLRNVIAREMIANTLIHRELSSSFIAKFVIEKDLMYVENGSRAAPGATLTPERCEPYLKNPIIAAFFRNIGRSDLLGSGVKTLYKYGQCYSGQTPKLEEGDVFRITVPLNENFSYDTNTEETWLAVSERKKMYHAMINAHKATGYVDNLLDSNELSAMCYLKENHAITTRGVKELTGLSANASRYLVRKLVAKELVVPVGGGRNRKYCLASELEGDKN